MRDAPTPDAGRPTVRNWSGSVLFRPRAILHPTREEELAQLVRRARREGRRVRVVGSLHSATGILETDQTLVVLDRMQGVVRHDRATCEAAVRPGTTLQQLGRDLLERDLALPNYGDAATQTIAGAISTGTHGTGTDMGALAESLVGGRLVTGVGEVLPFSLQDDPELLPALRLSLGALGIFSELRLRLVPAFRIQRREYCTSFAAAAPHLSGLIRENRNFDLYWYPRSDEVKLRLLNVVGGGTRDLPYAELVERHDGWAHEVIPKHSGLQARFDESEYAVPTDAGLDCLREVRARVRERWRSAVGWRVLYRTEAASDTWLSPAFDRATAHVSLHQNAELPHRAYFRDLETVFRRYGGRPHWAKKHTLRAVDLRPLYPRWDDFLALRKRLDPDGVFLNDYLHELLGVA